MRVAFARSLDLLLPPHLHDADGAAGLSSGYSGAAWSKITFVEAPVCDGCGLPFAYDLGAGVRCAACQTRPRAFARARAACVYDEHSRDLILKLKHADRPDLGRLFARWLSRAAAELIAEAELIVPVPLHRSRLFARRYNQAAEIARPLSRMAHVRYGPDLLLRRRDTGTQGAKSGRARRLNVRGAFVVPDRARTSIEARRVLLVDDVLTTGATAEACAKALQAAGARAVDLAVVARVREAADLLI